MDVMSIGILMGIAGTAAMDIWALILRTTLNMPLPNWGNVGRWVANLPTLFHDDIAAVPQVRHETAIGWVFHYAVGIAYGVFFVWIAGADWIAAPTFIPLWIFGLVTISAGWFLLQPGMGLGWALSKTPNPNKGRVMGLIAHTVFSLGMWMPVVLLG